MPAIKINKFLGTAPKVAPELLPDSAAQEAVNIKLYSGDLIPYRYPKVVADAGRSGTIQTIYPLHDTVTGDHIWLSWSADVDVAVATTLNDEEQRIYYTGDGVPKVTNYTLAEAGGPPYPQNYYELGLPLPTAVPSASATSFSQKTVSTYARDSGNIATMNLSAAHGLKSGAVVTVSGFNETATEDFNLTNVQITVTDSDSFTYYNVGSSLSVVGTDTDGRVDLAGGTILRSYVYTWMTPWLEESMPSEPSDPIYIKEGQVVTVSNLPTAAPAGDNFIRGFRLYRTVTSSEGSDYFRLRTVWFTNDSTFASRATNVVTLTMTYPHNLIAGDRFKTTGIAFGGVADTSFDITDGEVLAVTDDYTFTYTKAGADKASTATSAGTLQWDVSEPDSSAGVYYSGSTFSDNYDVNGLVYPLESLEYDAPDAAMTGLVAAHNNILAGFVGNEVCFSEPGKPWAWPLSYRIIVDSEIVGIAAVSGYILVLTDSRPWLIEGTAPSNMQPTRIDAPYPCTSKRGIVNMGYGVVFPSHGGLAVFGPQTGLTFVTNIVHDWDTWQEIDHENIVGEFYANKYFGSHPTGSFIFERDEQTGGNLITSAKMFTAPYYDSHDDIFYYVYDTTGDVYQWDHPNQPLMSITWKSKVIKTQEYINIGAARVVGEFAVSDEEAAAVVAYNVIAVAANVEAWSLVAELGDVNGGTISYVDPDTTATVYLYYPLDSMMINGDLMTTDTLAEVAGNTPVNFTLWVEGELVQTVTLEDSEIFRLPAGYRSDHFEVGVSGSARIKEIHLGETPYGLRQS